MKLQKITANKLNKLAKRKQIVCFGAGGAMLSFFESVQDLHLEDRIRFVVDNDDMKWGTKISVNEMDVEIVSLEVLASQNICEYVFLITASKYNEIFEQLQKYFSVKKKCYLLPEYRNRIAQFISKVTRCIPVQEYILLQGEGDTCENAIALGKYIREKNYFGKYRLVWLCDNPEKFKATQKEKYIKRNLNLEKKKYKDLWNYYYYMNCSKYLMFENLMITKSRCEQISVYMNHGAPPLKSTVGKIVLAKDVDYSLCPSKNVADIVATQFGIDTERLLYCGSPRTDIFYTDKKNQRLFDELHMGDFGKVILWAPTFRQMNRANRVDSSVEYPYGVPILSTSNDYDRLRKCLEKNNILLVIKPHLHQDMSKINIESCKNIKIVAQTDLDEMDANVYELLKLSDSLITDYSTIAFEYMILDRPICYTIDDMDKYHIGFSVDNPLDYMPGMKAIDMEGFIKYFENISNEVDSFREQRRELERYIHDDNGGHCEKLLKALNIM